MKNKSHVLFYRSGKEWRWSIRASNGKIIGASSEGYHGRARCVANFNLITCDFVMPTGQELKASKFEREFPR